MIRRQSSREISPRATRPGASGSSNRTTAPPAFPFPPPPSSSLPKRALAAASTSWSIAPLLRAQVAPPREWQPSERSTARRTARASEGPSTTTRARRRGRRRRRFCDVVAEEEEAFRAAASPSLSSSLRGVACLLALIARSRGASLGPAEARSEGRSGCIFGGGDDDDAAASTMEIDVSDVDRGRLALATGPPAPVHEGRGPACRITLQPLAAKGVEEKRVCEQKFENCFYLLAEKKNKKNTPLSLLPPPRNKKPLLSLLADISSPAPSLLSLLFLYFPPSSSARVEHLVPVWLLLLFRIFKEREGERES